MSILDRARELRKVIENMAAELPDETALENVELFPPYEVNKEYAAGDRFNYEGTLYRVVQAHTSQADWDPSILPALYKVVSLDEWPEWIQPTGSQDAYADGDKVTHNDKHWVSKADNNVWEPGVYGWDEVE